MGEDKERGLGRAYVISDSRFEREPGGYPRSCLWRDRAESTWAKGEGGKIRINGRLEQREKPTGTGKSQEREREEDGMRNRDSDCFAGDMIIFSVSVFKEDVAFGSEGPNEKEGMPEGEGESALVHERQGVTRTARGASPSGSSSSSSSSRERKEVENETAGKSRRMSSWFLKEREK